MFRIWCLSSQVLTKAIAAGGGVKIMHKSGLTDSALYYEAATRARRRVERRLRIRRFLPYLYPSPNPKVNSQAIPARPVLHQPHFRTSQATVPPYAVFFHSTLPISIYLSYSVVYHISLRVRRVLGRRGDFWCVPIPSWLVRYILWKMISPKLKHNDFIS
jgi:hypothetical protein